MRPVTTFWQPVRCISLLLAFVVLLGLAAPLLAQSLRDPTLPPAAVTPSAPGDFPAAMSVQSGAVAVLVRYGTPYLVVGSRLYAKGQQVGQARIERITETEVWLREAGSLRKVQVFSGIERHVSQPPAAVKKPLKPVRKTVPLKP